jgi:hypothetical protein
MTTPESIAVCFPVQTLPPVTVDTTQPTYASILAARISLKNSNATTIASSAGGGPGHDGGRVPGPHRNCVQCPCCSACTHPYHWGNGSQHHRRQSTPQARVQPPNSSATITPIKRCASNSSPQRRKSTSNPNLNHAALFSPTLSTWCKAIDAPATLSPGRHSPQNKSKHI